MSVAASAALAHWREREYSRLDRLDHVYLDYTGGALYAERQLREHRALLDSHVFGNPHSHNPASDQMTELVEGTRRRVLEFFRASPDEYTVIFTANASQALKLVGESFPFAAGGTYCLTADNHNSVVGIREFARSRGAAIRYISMQPPALEIDGRVLVEEWERPAEAPRLFAYPAQSNFSGLQYPLEWIGEAQRRGWDVLLDAAAYVPTNPLDLSRVHPDFVCLSFYKMFGYPTGVGCLLARTEALERLRRPWFAGGTITVASVRGDRHFFAQGAAAFEDGTLDYLNIPAAGFGLALLEEAGLTQIQRHTHRLASEVARDLAAIHHANGKPVAIIYGGAENPRRGNAVTFNFFDSAGAVIPHWRVEPLAAQRRISMRTGCFCNPGGGETALGLSRELIRDCFDRNAPLPESRFTVEDLRQCAAGQASGAVRVSFGLPSNSRDAERFLVFAREFRS